MRLGIRFGLSAFGLFLGVSATLQYLAGAYRAAFSGYPDEAAHYVTGLMVHDWIASGFPWPPMAYAQNYYLHYPKVALGHWPPVFYVIEALWGLVFSTSRVSIIVLMSVFMSLLALVLAKAVAADYGRGAGLLAGLLLVALPLSQAWTQNVMADVPVAVFVFGATLAYGRYLDSAGARHAALFGVLASAAMLTKGNAVALALLPPIAVALTGRWSLVRRASFWLPLGIVVALCGPWYVLTARGTMSAFLESPGLAYSRAAVVFYAAQGASVLGLALLPIVGVGLFDRLWAPMRRRSLDGRWAAVAALLCATFVLLTLVPASYEPRYLIPVAPVLVMFLVAGSARFAASTSRLHLTPRLGSAAVTTLVVVLFALQTFHVPKKTETGFIQVAADILEGSRLEHPAPVVLVSSERDGEGLLVSEIAMADDRPRHIVFRATKALARTDWNATVQESYYTTPADLLRALEEIAVGVLVLDLSPPRVAFEHQRLLLETVARFPARFELVQTYRTSEPRSEIRLYRVLGPGGPASGKLARQEPERW